MTEMTLYSTKEIMSGHKITHIDKTRGLELCAQKNAMTRIYIQEWEQEDRHEMQ